MKTFRVKAEVITVCYIDVEANSIEEANEIAQNSDGGDFITDDDSGGEFNILKNLTKEVCSNCDGMELDLDEECSECGREA